MKAPRERAPVAGVRASWTEELNTKAKALLRLDKKVVGGRGRDLATDIEEVPGRALEELADNSSGSSEPIGSDELDRLAALMFAAYAGTTDDEGETVSDHRTEITRTRRGAYSPTPDV